MGHFLYHGPMKTIFEIDLLAVAKARTHASIAAAVLWVFLIGLIISTFNNAANPSSLMMTMNFVYFGAVIWVLVATVLLQVSMGTAIPTIVLTAIVTLVLPMLVPLSVISQSSTVLRLAGAKPGFIGLSQTEKEKITPGHCRGCGYSREGIGLLDPCPECTRVPQVI